MSINIRPLTYEVVQSQRKLFNIGLKLKLFKYELYSLKTSIDFCERFDYCRNVTYHEQDAKYNYPCRHTESAPNHIAES